MVIILKIANITMDIGKYAQKKKNYIQIKINTLE